MGREYYSVMRKVEGLVHNPPALLSPGVLNAAQLDKIVEVGSCELSFRNPLFVPAHGEKDVTVSNNGHLVLSSGEVALMESRPLRKGIRDFVPDRVYYERVSREDVHAYRELTGKGITAISLVSLLPRAFGDFVLKAPFRSEAWRSASNVQADYARRELKIAGLRPECFDDLVNASFHVLGNLSACVSGLPEVDEPLTLGFATRKVFCRDRTVAAIIDGSIDGRQPYLRARAAVLQDCYSRPHLARIIMEDKEVRKLFVS